jgi:hypothetical protein
LTPSSLKIAPTAPNQFPKARKCSQNAIVVLIFILQLFLERSTPRPPKCLRWLSIGVKMARQAPCWTLFVPFWPQVRPSCCHLAIARLSKIGHLAHLAASSVILLYFGHFARSSKPRIPLNRIKQYLFLCLSFSSFCFECVCFSYWLKWNIPWEKMQLPHSIVGSQCIS